MSCTSSRTVAGNQNRFRKDIGDEFPNRLSVTLLGIAWLLGPIAGLAQVASGPLTLPDALSTTLERNPAIRYQIAVVDTERALQRQTTGRFDTQIAAGGSASRQHTPAFLGIRANSIESDSVALTGSSQRELRNGITIGPEISIERDHNSYSNALGNARTRVLYRVNIPMLKGRGRDVVGASETAAAQNVDAALLSLNDTIARLLEATAEAYWNVRGAMENLRIARDSEAQGARFVEIVQTLIDADKKARNDIYAIRANLASRSASRIAAETQLYQARQQLGFAMGLAPEELGSLAEPGDPFPSPDPALAQPLTADRNQLLLSAAFKRRADLLAEQKRRQSNQTLITLDRNALKPQLDVVLEGGYSGLTDGRGLPTLHSTFPGAHGPDLIGSVNYRFAPRNNLAEGRLTQQILTVRLSDLRQQDLARSIALEISRNLEGTRRGAGQIQSAEASVTAYASALEGEQEKLSLGLGSLLDILNVEDRLRSARLTAVDARISYSLSIARLRLAAGAIVAPDQPIQSVGEDVFLQVPPEALPGTPN